MAMKQVLSVLEIPAAPEATWTGQRIKLLYTSFIQSVLVVYLNIGEITLEVTRFLANKKQSKTLQVK